MLWRKQWISVIKNGRYFEIQGGITDVIDIDPLLNNSNYVKNYQKMGIIINKRKFVNSENTLLLQAPETNLQILLLISETQKRNVIYNMLLDDTRRRRK